MIRFNVFVILLWISLLLFFSFGHYCVDVVMVLLTTYVKFLFPFAVHILLKILVSSYCQYCFQKFCCHVAAAKKISFIFATFPFVLVPISLHCKKSAVAARVDCLGKLFHYKMSFSSACDFLPFCHQPCIQ